MQGTRSQLHLTSILAMAAFMLCTMIAPAYSANQQQNESGQESWQSIPYGDSFAQDPDPATPQIPEDQPSGTSPIELVWQKGNVRVVPYGSFWSDMTSTTQRTFPGSFTLFVFSTEEEGEGEFSIDARRSRFGLDVFGPTIPNLDNAESAGRLEIDFQGEFITENRATVLLRQAYWELKNERFRILV
jgi:hypothetical protein